MIGLGGVRDGSSGGDEVRGRQAKSRGKLSYILLHARDGRLLKRLTSGPKIVFPAVDFVTIPIRRFEIALHFRELGTRNLAPSGHVVPREP